MKERIVEFIKNEYGVKAEYLFQDDTAVFRNRRNKKWFAIIMRIPANKLKLNGDAMVYIINLKNYPSNVSLLRGTDGIFPAYHMNKENWITVLLDKNLPFGMMVSLIDQSYQIIDNKK